MDLFYIHPLLSFYVFLIWRLLRLLKLLRFLKDLDPRDRTRFDLRFLDLDDFRLGDFRLGDFLTDLETLRLLPLLVTE